MDGDNVLGRLKSRDEEREETVDASRRRNPAFAASTFSAALQAWWTQICPSPW
jgi:hypothetical protein